MRSRLRSIHAELFLVRLARAREGHSSRARSAWLAASSLCGGRQDLLAGESIGHRGLVPAALHAPRRNHGVSAHRELSVDQLEPAARAVRSRVERCVRADRRCGDRWDSGRGGVRDVRVSDLVQVGTAESVERAETTRSSP